MSNLKKNNKINNYFYIFYNVERRRIKFNKRKKRYRRKL